MDVAEGEEAVRKSVGWRRERDVNLPQVISIDSVID